MLFAVIIILGAILLYFVINSYISESGLSVVSNAFFMLFSLVIYMLLGLHLTSEIVETPLYCIYWVAYTLLAFTIVTLIVLLSGWETIRHKRGRFGVRGHRGDSGRMGDVGSCSIDAATSVGINRLVVHLEDWYSTSVANVISIAQNMKPANARTLAAARELPLSLLSTNESGGQLINDYLREKIEQLVTSAQYKNVVEYMTNENRPLDTFYKYLANIWEEWFHLIATTSSSIIETIIANLRWFTDKYADESFEFATNGAPIQNPFDKIREYDVYYWGLVATFSRLHVEICDSNVQSPETLLPPRIKLIESNDYKRVWDDWKSGAPIDVSMWALKPVVKNNTTYYPIGWVGTKDEEHNAGRYNITKRGSTTTDELEYKPDDMDGEAGNGPVRSSILVAGDVKNPERYEKYFGLGGHLGGNMWRPIPPRGYRCLGDLFGPLETVQSTNIKCVPAECTEEVVFDDVQITRAGGIWFPNNDPNNKILEMRQNRPARDNAYNIMVGAPRKHPAKFYKLRAECTESVELEKKPLDDVYSRVGIGWHGEPDKKSAAGANAEQHSIFTFLGLVPEGILTNLDSGRRYYIVHYGGVEVNCYNVLLGNRATKKWDLACEASATATAHGRAVRLVRSNTLQQWQLRHLTGVNSGGVSRVYGLVNKQIQRYLIISLDANTGDEVIKTEDSAINGGKFAFTSAYAESEKSL